MSGLLDELNDHNDREMTLGTGALLGIFVGLVVVCAVFFGLGYSLGHKSAPPPASTVSAATTAPSKPAVPTPSSQDVITTSSPAASAPPIVTPPPAKLAKADIPPATSTRTKSVASKQVSTGASGGQTMVQLMAAAQSEDADVLAAALRKRGYHAVVRNEPDHLYHVQIGPFPSRADADTMRHKLQADGYNAILK